MVASSPINPASFRDPCGFVFHHEDTVLRQINDAGRDDYEHLLSSGLYDELIAHDLLVAHVDADVQLAPRPGAWKVIKPAPLPFISYPYEWSFGQFKSAALLCLEIQTRALEHGMTLKDASAYNVQFVHNKPVFIDTLSFQKLTPGTPWVAYRQFCQHFLAPLALMSKCDVRLNRMLQLFIDGIPLELANSMLPWRSKLNLSLAMHITLHARSQRSHAHKAAPQTTKKRHFSKHAFLALVDNLKGAIEGLKWLPGGTEWHDYYARNNNYGEVGLLEKDAIVERMVTSVAPICVWDLGANVGRYSRIAAAHAEHVVAWDVDPACVESNYQMCCRDGDTKIIPLCLDLTNPSPNIGWNNAERLSFLGRSSADLILALGLVHHLALSNNVPLAMIAELLARAGENLIIEFVPKQDSQVEKLLATREDVFPNYHAQGFEDAFQSFFKVQEKEQILGSQRILYRMVRT